MSSMGLVSVITELPGVPLPPGVGTAEKHRTPSTPTSLTPHPRCRLGRRWGPPPHQAMWLGFRGAETVWGGTRVGWGLGDLGEVGRRSPSSCLLRDEGQGSGASGAAAREERVKTRPSKPEGGGFNRRPQSGASWFCGYSPLALTYRNSGLWTRGQPDR